MTAVTKSDGIWPRCRDLERFSPPFPIVTTPCNYIGGVVDKNNCTMTDRGTACLLTKIAVATPEAVLVITLHFPDESNPTVLYNALFNTVTPLAFVGFNLDRLALQLFGEYGLRILNAVDIFSIDLSSIDDESSGKGFMKAYEGDIDVALATTMLDNENDPQENDTTLATRAWVGAVLEQASEVLALSLAAATPINLSLLPDRVCEKVILFSVLFY
jgi:hypothetical protein